MEPFTIRHFEAYTSKIVLDTDEYWELEPFQKEIVKPILAGVREVLALLPEGCGKTTLMAGFALYHLDFTRFPWVPVMAASRDQAEIMAVQAYDMIRRSGWEAQGKYGADSLRRFRIYEGYRRIHQVRNGGRGLKVYAADAATSDGGIPTLVLADELHRWDDLGTYRLWKGKLRKRHGQIAGISTAGEPGGEFEEMREAIRAAASKAVRRGAMTRYEAPNITMLEWMVRDPSKISDMKEVKKANPFSGITEESLREEFNSPTGDLGDFRRLKCNLPSRTIQAAITDVEWDRAASAEKIPEGQSIYAGVDVAWKLDTFAITPLWDAGDRYLLGEPEILVPPRDGSMMPLEDVTEAFEGIMERNPISVVVIDPTDARDVIRWLEIQGIEVVERPQSPTQAGEDYAAFMKCLRAATKTREETNEPLGRPLRHTGHRGLRQHVMNAIARVQMGDKKRFDRPSQSRAKRKQARRVIDALSAAAMVVWYVDTLEPVNDEPLVAWAGGDTHADGENPWAPKTDESLAQSEMPLIG